jgi:hypothetical protein
MTTLSAQAFHESFVHGAKAAEHYAQAMSLAVPLLAPGSSLNKTFGETLLRLLSEQDLGRREDMMQQLQADYLEASREAIRRIEGQMHTMTDEDMLAQLNARLTQWHTDWAEIVKIQLELDAAKFHQTASLGLHDAAVGLQAAGR